MSKPAMALTVIVLTVIFYLPVWFVIGAYLYPQTHPDYWHWATPNHVIPISALLALTFVSGLHWILRRR